MRVLTPFQFVKINERVYVYKQKEATDEKESQSVGTTRRTILVRRQKEMAGAKTGFRQTQADQTWETRRSDWPVFWRFYSSSDARLENARFEKYSGAECSICAGGSRLGAECGCAKARIFGSPLATAVMDEGTQFQFQAVSVPLG